MIRKIIHINEDLCNGCGACAAACHEGAIGMVDGKAKLLRDDYCDGLGNCLPACPTGAITFEEREAAAYDEEAVKARMAQQAHQPQGGCPGSRATRIEHASPRVSCASTLANSINPAQPAQTEPVNAPSQLMQWPVQIKLVPVNAPYFDGARLLIAADCTAYARGDFHDRFMKNHITIIGCPKLDEGDYADKLTAILAENDIKSVTVVRMEVPCCGGIEFAVKKALQACGKMIPWQVVTIGCDGTILD